MEILPNIPGIEQHVFGDIYFGYFVPTVLRGRSDAFQRDINAILSEWVLLSLNGGFDKFIERDSDFGLKLFGTIFRELCFSKILTTHPLESISTVWEVFWGVLADCFNSTIREDEDQVWLLRRSGCIYIMFYLYHCQSNSNILPIPLAVETITNCVDTCFVISRKFSISTVLEVFIFLLRRHCIRDRTGRPMGSAINEDYN
ncbi:uncharacterized protein BBOV_IV003780 [Babesia bovis T2Bo]|uniref:uncharacterized protein n=1 Tax=Babesia bovis T2Bo TaxID=484906 RepID=UPI001D4BA08A|nr:uncharacterized protein BBOV_IV003780 [Babesia bovis T2Bo]EDO06738.2 hypothetical protein BBOV_IV003780 [Babesia bovis T2Bo]